MEKEKQIIEIIEKVDLCAISYKDGAKAILNLFDVRLSLQNNDYLNYLRGFVDGYGGEEPHEEFPNGFNNINEMWDKIEELKGNEA